MGPRRWNKDPAWRDVFNRFPLIRSPLPVQCATPSIPVQIQPLCSQISDCLRNPSRTLSYTELRSLLVALRKKCHLIGGDALLKVQTTVDFILDRGDSLVLDQVDPRRILQVFSDMMPSQHASRSHIKAADRKTIIGLWKQQGGFKAKHLMHAVAAGGGGGGGMPPPPSAALSAAAQPYYATAPLPPPVVPTTGPLMLPLPTPPGSAAYTPTAGGGGASAHYAGGGAAKRKGGRGGGGRGRGGKHLASYGPPPPPQLPTVQQAQELKTFNDLLQARQEAMLASPFQYVCRRCQSNNRNFYHRGGECAYLICNHCKRGGHRDKDCTFPAYP